MSVYNLVSPGIPDCRALLTKFDQLLLTLMKLRLNLGDQDLAIHFNISQPSVSQYFRMWIDHMYSKLSLLIKWPEREQLKRTMPIEFKKKYECCVVIIDCFEIFIERPSSLEARAQTWSNYKRHNTVKYLIGVTPQGTVSFISQGWGGRAFDVYYNK